MDPIAETTMRLYMDAIAASKKVKSLKDWYLVQLTTLSTASVHLRPFGGLATVLSNLYPHHPWQKSRFGRISPHKRTVQRKLIANIIETVPKNQLTR